MRWLYYFLKQTISVMTTLDFSTHILSILHQYIYRYLNQKSFFISYRLGIKYSKIFYVLDTAAEEII